MAKKNEKEKKRWCTVYYGMICMLNRRSLLLGDDCMFSREPRGGKLAFISAETTRAYFILWPRPVVAARTCAPLPDVSSLLRVRRHGALSGRTRFPSPTISRPRHSHFHRPLAECTRAITGCLASSRPPPPHAPSPAMHRHRARAPVRLPASVHAATPLADLTLLFASEI